MEDKEWDATSNNLTTAANSRISSSGVAKVTAKMWRNIAVGSYFLLVAMVSLSIPLFLTGPTLLGYFTAIITFVIGVAIYAVHEGFETGERQNTPSPIHSTRLKQSSSDVLHVEIRNDLLVAAGIAVFTSAVFLLAMISLFSIWPRTSQELTLNTTRTVLFVPIGSSIMFGPETVLMLSVVLAGILGACSYSFFAIALHLGHYHDFDKRWTAWYLLRPLLGASLAFIVTLLARGGVLTVGADPKNINLMGLAGISGLVGIFAEHAIRKLGEVADTLFGKGSSDP